MLPCKSFLFRYAESTRPIIDTYDNLSKCIRIDANVGTPEEVYAQVKPRILKNNDMI